MQSSNDAFNPLQDSDLYFPDSFEGAHFVHRAFPTDSGYVHVGYRATSAPSPPSCTARSDHSRSLRTSQPAINPDDGPTLHDPDQAFIPDASRLPFPAGYDPSKVIHPVPQTAGIS